MLEKRNRNLWGVQDETVAECCCEPLKQKSGKSTLAALEPRLRKREDGAHLRGCREHYASARKGLNELAVGVPGRKPIHPQYLARMIDRVDDDDHRTAFSGLGVSEEQPVLLSKGGWADRVFNQVIIDFNEQILEINRQKLICLINVGRVGLAALGWLHLLNPYLILVGVFCIGIGFAFNPPAWTSLCLK